MTDITELLRSYDHAKATGSDITLSPTDLSVLLQVASIIGDQNRPAITLPASPVSAPTPAPSRDAELISIDEIETTLRIGATTLWRLRKSDVTFPKPVRTSARRKQFIRAEFNAWLLSRRD